MSWLLAAREQSGLWSAGTVRECADTLAAIDALQTWPDDEARAAVLLARGALALQPQRLGVPNGVAALVSQRDPTGLLQSRRTDGSWGAVPEHAGDPYHTAWAMRCLCELGVEPDGGWGATVSWLTAQQDETGAWRLGGHPEAGDVHVTAEVLAALRALPDQTDQSYTRALATGAQWLIATVDPATADPVSMARAYAEAVRVDPPAMHTDVLQKILQAQHADGCWDVPARPERRVWATATVLRCLEAATLPAPGATAELSITADRIRWRNGPVQPGERAEADVLVVNHGAEPATDVAVRITLGHPWAAHELVDEPLVPLLSPGGSARLPLSFGTAGWAAARRLWVWVDPGNRVREIDRTDNLAYSPVPVVGLPRPDPTEFPDLCIVDGGVRIALQRPADGVTRLLDSRIVRLSILIANLGARDAGRFLVTAYDGDLPVVSTDVGGLGAGEYRELHLPWTPLDGAHTITVRVDPLQEVQEADEDNNRALVTTTVTGHENSLRVTRLIDGEHRPPPLRAYDCACLSVSSVTPGSTPQISIFNAEGDDSGACLLPHPDPGRYQWLVGTCPPGRYTARCTFRAAGTGTVIGTASASMDIAATRDLQNLRVTVTPRQLVAGDVAAPALTAELINGANVEGQWQVSAVISDPDGAVLGTWPQADVELQPSQASWRVDLGTLANPPLTAAGTHRVTVTARDTTGVSSISGSTNIEVLPQAHVSMEQKVTPDTVQPVSGIRVQTVLRVAAPAQDTLPGRLPAAVGSVRILAELPLKDASASAATLHAIDILDRTGLPVPDGSMIAAWTPYGTLSSEQCQGRVALSETGDAAVDVIYSPAGGTLRAGEQSLVPVYLHQWVMEDDGARLGIRLATVTIELEGDGAE